MSNTSSHKRLAINTIASFVSTFVGFGITFLLSPYLIKQLGSETFQFYPIANNFVTYMAIVINALNSMSSRFITIEVVNHEWDNVNKLYSSLFYSNLILCLVLFLPAILIIVFADTILQIPTSAISDVKWLFALTFTSMFVDIFGSIYSVATITRDRIDIRSANTIMVAVIRATVLILMFYLFKPRLIYIGAAVLLASITQLCVQYIQTRRLMPQLKIKLSLFNKSIVKQLLVSGIWNSINSLGSTLLVGLTLVLTNSLVGETAGGQLSIAQTVSHILNTVISITMVVFLPRMLHSYAIDSHKGLANETFFGQKIISVICVSALVVLVIMGEDFFRLWVPSEDSVHLYKLLIILLLPLFVQSNLWIFTNVFTVENRLKVPALSYLIVGIINILIILILYFLNALEANTIIIVTSIISSLYCLIFYPIYAAKVVNVQIKRCYRNFAKVVIASIIFIPICVYMHSRITIVTWGQFFLCALFWGVIILIFYLSVVFSKKDKQALYRFIKKDNNED